MKIQLNLLSHQAEFISDTEHRFLALVGGYGSGKTRALAVKLITLAALNHGYEGAALSPTHMMARKVLIPTLDQCLEELNIPYEFSKSAATYDLEFHGRTTKLHIMSAENYKRLAGLNLAFFGVDEMDLINSEVAENAWRMLSSRLRRGRVYQGVAVSTPEGYSFMYRYFEKEAATRADRRLIRASTYDNPFLPDTFIPSLLDTFPEALISAYLHGHFTNLKSGQVYYCFDRKQNHTDKTIEDFPQHILHVGVDFNVGNCSAVVAVIDKQLPFVIDELTGAQNTEDLIKKLKARYPGRPIHVYPDSAGKSEHTNATKTDISLLKSAGFIVNYHSRNPRVMDRVGSVNSMLKNAKGERRMLVNTDRCQQLTEALEQQGFDAYGMPDKSSGLDHILDALGYLTWFRWPIVLRGGLTQVQG